MIMAKDSNNNYVKIEDIEAKNNNEYQDIEKIISKQGNLLYNKYREIENIPPIIFKGKGKNLENYRIYGQTVDGESVGDRTGNLFDGSLIHRSVIEAAVSDDDPNRRSIVVDISNFNNGDKITFSRETSAGDRLQMYQVSSPLKGGRLLNTNVIKGDSETLLATITLDNISDYPYLMIFLNGATNHITDEELLASKIMINVGNTPLPYEPYGYKVPVTVEGKNLAPWDKRWALNIDGLITANDTSYASIIDVHNIDYIYLFGAVNKLNSGIYRIGKSNILPEIGANTTRITSTDGLVNVSDCDYCVVVCQLYGTSTTRQVLLDEFMITAGNTAPTKFEPYHAPVTTPIYLPEQIKKVGDEAEYIDYGEQKQYIETTDGQEKYVVGLNVDFENKTFTRLADAIGLSKGTDFDIFSAFGGRRRCNVADNGTITAYYGDANYTEDGSNGQVMVYQPAFYYKVEPLKTEAQESGVGYHLRNVNYYISNYQGEGYKLHPAFYNEAGDRVDYILLGAYEGCIYDTSANAYITDDSQVMNSSEDKFSSIANVKPASGRTQNLTRPNLETICKNRGNGWHSLDIRIASMEQLLMAIELGTMNTQTGAESNGIVSITNSSYNCASITGSTASLGNTSGQAAATISDIGGTQTVETTNGKTAYSFRGDENLWGNIWKFVLGVNIWGDGTMHGGVPYICKDYNFAESKRTDNYESAGFSVPNASGYVNALGYSKNFDWLMMPSEIGGGGDGSLPVGDYTYVTDNLNGYRITQLGGFWTYGAVAGGFCWALCFGDGDRNRSYGGRLVYVPQIEKQHIYTTELDVTLPTLPILTGTNVLSVGTAVQPSKVYLKGKLKRTIYGWHVDPDISDSSNAVTYLKDAIGMTPASMGSSTFNYGSWQNAFFMPKPCMLKSNGKVDYYLDPNDYTKKLNGTASDISNPNYDGNAMMQWPKIWFKYVKGVKEGQGYFYVANYKADGNFHCWCNYDSENNEIDHFYTAIYNGTSFANYSSSKTYVINDFAIYDNKLYKCNTDIVTAESFDSTKWDIVSNTAPAINKMRSLSGIRLTNNNGNAQTNTTTEVTRAEANNTTAAKEWYIETFSDRLLIKGLLVLMGKSLNTQTVFGRGLDSGGQTAKEAYITGSLNDKGLFYGITANGNSAVKVFGMENFWGCVWHRTAGLITNNHAIKLKLTYGTKDGSTVVGYNQTGNGYIDNGISPYTNGYVQKMSYNKYGFIPAVVTGGSQSTYYADYHYQNENYTGVIYALFGGGSAYGLDAGAFYLSLAFAPGSAYWLVAASLSCKPLL